MKLAEILTGPETWTKGRFYTRDSRCLVAAIARMLEAGGAYTFGGFATELVRFARVVGPAADRGISAWNDAPERTWEEVAAAVDAYDRYRLLEGKS